MEWTYPIVLVASTILALATIHTLKGKLLSFGIRGIDINKAEKPLIPESGGMLLLPGIWILTLLFVQLEIINPLSYAILFVITCFAAMGFFDDGFRLFKKEEGWVRYMINRGLILFLFTLPFTYLVSASTFESGEGILLYLYIIISGILILLTSSLANSFAGLNGWEIGSSAILTGALTVMVSFSTIYTSTLVSLGLIMFGATLALYFFNKYPAKIFPGDSGTLLLGSFMGCMILFLDQWYIALCLFFPHVYDILLKVRTNRGDMSQKVERPYVLNDGKLEVPNSGKLDFAKLIIHKLGPMPEKDVSRKIQKIVLNNALFWTLLYILVKII